MLLIHCERCDRDAEYRVFEGQELDARATAMVRRLLLKQHLKFDCEAREAAREQR